MATEDELEALLVRLGGYLSPHRSNDGRAGAVLEPRASFRDLVACPNSCEALPRALWGDFGCLLGRRGALL
eukprot:9472298-Pyramimonas_sp.AAC.1